MHIDAILWDYDGTLVNSAPKNIEITKEILSVVAPRLTGNNLPFCLTDEHEYHIANHQSGNWQDLYINYYGMTEEEMHKAGPLWTEYQLRSSTPVDLFEGIEPVIKRINLPQGICSQNSSENIQMVLKKNNIDHKFNSVIGYNDMPVHLQKPAPYAGIKCLGHIFQAALEDKTILYIGDHEGDVQFARNIRRDMQGKVNIISVAVKYSGANTAGWVYKPDFEIEQPANLLEMLNF